MWSVWLSKWKIGTLGWIKDTTWRHEHKKKIAYPPPGKKGKTENRKELAMLKHALEWNDMRVSTKNYKDGYSRRSWLTHVRYNTWVALQRKALYRFMAIVWTILHCLLYFLISYSTLFFVSLHSLQDMLCKKK